MEAEARLASLGRRILQRARSLFRGGAARRHELVGEQHIWRKSRDFQERFVLAQGLRPEHRLIDLGCGTLRGGLPLIRHLEPGHYTGVEVRPEALEAGRKELREAGLEAKAPNLIQSGDLDTLELGPADFIWSFAVLIHMPDPVLESCFRFVQRHLTDAGVFLATVNVGEEGQAGGWAGFPVMRHAASFYDALAARHGLRGEDLGSLVELGNEGDVGKLPPHERRMYRFVRAAAGA